METAGPAGERRPLPGWFCFAFAAAALAAAAACALLPTRQALAAIGAAGFAAFAFWKPELALVALFGAGMFSPYKPVTIYHILYRKEYISLWTIRPIAGANLIDLGLAVILGALLVRVAVRRSWPSRSSLDRAALALGVLVVLAALRAALSRSEVQKWSYLLFGLRMYTYPLLVYFLTTRLLKKEEPRVRGFLFALFGILCGWILYTFAWSAFAGGVVLERGGLRLLVVGYEIYAMLLVTCLFLAYWAGRYWRGLRTLWLGGFPLLMFLVVLMSGRRWSLGLFLLGPVLVLAHFSLPRVARFLLGLGLIGVTLAIIVTAAFPKLMIGLEDLAEKMGSRGVEKHYVKGIDTLGAELDNVFLNLDRYGGWYAGLGLGRKWKVLNGTGIMRSFDAYGEDMWGEWIYSLHPPLARQLLEFGLIGFAWWAGVLAVGWRRRRRALRRRATPFCRLSLVGLGPVLLLLYLSPAEPPNGILLGLLAGVFSRLCDLAEEERPDGEQEARG